MLAVTMTATQSFTEIPVIDLLLASNAETEAHTLAQLRRALVEVGFLYVKNHGVPESVISDIQSALPRLFALPPEAKADVALAKSPHFLGYSGDGAETTAGRADRREQFEFATELEATWRKGLPLSERLRGPNPVSPAIISIYLDIPRPKRFSGRLHIQRCVPSWRPTSGR